MRTKLNLKLIQESARQLSQKSEKDKNVFLRNLAEILERNTKVILEANKKDIEVAVKKNLPAAFIQRLILDENGIKKLILKLINLQKLESGIGCVLDKKILGNGILLQRVVVPIGVIMVIYEARPEVTIDVAALGVKSGNAVILKGGSEAIYTNKALYECIRKALVKSSLAGEFVSFIEDRDFVNQLLKQNNSIDLVIARGGYEMVKKVTNKSKIPVLSHSAGGARIYIDKSANLTEALDILVNAKISKPAACNSLDAILIHKEVEDSFIVELVKLLANFHVTVLGDNKISALTGVKKTTKKDWDTEFLGLTVLMKMVKNAEEAIDFINKHTKRHSEGIVAEDKDTINKFTSCVDAAAIFINCSTRFHDGFEFGMGSEIGIATGKLHARGPVGLQELTTYKWEAYGNGQIRK